MANVVDHRRLGDGQDQRHLASSTGSSEAETPQLADSLAAGLAMVAVARGRARSSCRSDPARSSAAPCSPVAPPILVAALAAARDARRRAATATPAATVTTTAPRRTATTTAAATTHTSAVVPPKPYDPALPIDLGGVEGVTPQQQAAAENLLADHAHPAAAVRRPGRRRGRWASCRSATGSSATSTTSTPPT